MNRRAFLASTAVSAIRVYGANDQLRGAVIGAGGRGQYMTAQFKEVGVDMAAVCDVYEPNLQAGLKEASTGAKPYSDYRKILDDKSIDVVLVTTPDHWHAKMTIDAVEAGKDVYVEKPMAHTIEEGFEMIKAARQHRRIVQVGTQRRSAPMFMKARELMQDIGEMHLVTSQWLNHQVSLRDRKLEGALDWKQWLGSSPKRDVDAVRFFNWYYFWDYSGGLMVGQAAHIVDAIHWFAGVSYPSAIVCASSPTTLKGGEVPETTTMSIEYPEGLLATFTCGYKAMKYHWFMDQLKQFHGYRARLDVGREWYKLYPQSNEMDMKPSVDERMPGSFEPASRAHIRNFLDCVKSRDEPNATVENGQWTNVVLCMAMEALQHRRRVEYDPRTRKMV